MLEKKIERYGYDQITLAGGMCIKLYCSSVTGLPDRLALFPGGKIVFIEFKRKSKEPSMLQLRMHRKLRTLGFEILVIDTKIKVDLLIKEKTR